MRLKITSFSEAFGAVDERALKHSLLTSRPLRLGVNYRFRLAALLTSIYVYSLLDEPLHNLLPRRLPRSFVVLFVRHILLFLLYRN